MARHRFQVSNTVLIAMVLTFSLLFRIIKPKQRVKMEIFREIRTKYVEQRIEQKPYFAPVAPHSKPSPRMIELYRIQVPQRRAYLEASLRYQIETHNFIYNNLAPEVYCPELVRVGSTNDGGKWICSPFRIPRNCTIISLGLFNEITFEQELQYIINKRCRIYAYDSTDQETKTMVVLNKIRTRFKKATIAAETNLYKNEYSLEDLLSESNAGNIEIFKCDIEGVELDVLPNFLKKHKPAQVLVEVHGTPAQMITFLSIISRQGYYLFSHQINGAYHNMCEFSFIHEKALLQYGATPLARYLDVPIKLSDAK